MLPEVNSSELYAGCLSEQTAVQTNAYTKLWQIIYPTAFYMANRDEMRAEEYAQRAIERIFHKIDSCESPATFIGWAKQITRNLIVDELRRQQRLVDWDETRSWPETGVSLEERVLEKISVEEWRVVLQQAPLSDRSRRVIIGRFLDDTPDETLSYIESELAQAKVRPSHIQTTRSKNLSKLRTYLADFAGNL